MAEWVYYSMTLEQGDFPNPRVFQLEGIEDEQYFLKERSTDVRWVEEQSDCWRIDVLLSDIDFVEYNLLFSPNWFDSI